MNNPLNLKPGARVVIYSDPISRLRPEGMAELVSRESVDGAMETWWVRFPDPYEPKPKQYRRRILNEAIPQEAVNTGTNQKGAGA